MDKKQLMKFREEIEIALAERKALGDYDANSKYINFLLQLMADLTDHSISQYQKKS